MVSCTVFNHTHLKALVLLWTFKILLRKTKHSRFTICHFKVNFIFISCAKWYYQFFFPYQNDYIIFLKKWRCRLFGTGKTHFWLSTQSSTCNQQTWIMIGCQGRHPVSKVVWNVEIVHREIITSCFSLLMVHSQCPECQFIMYTCI